MSKKSLNIITPVNWFHPLNRDLLAKWKVLPGIYGRLMPEITGRADDGVLGTTAKIIGRKEGFGAINSPISGNVIIPNNAAWDVAVSGYTVNFWVKVLLIANFDVFFGFGGWAQGGASEIYQNNNKFTGAIRSTGSFVMQVNTSSVDYLTTLDNTFHMVTTVFNADISRGFVYSDGELIGTDSFVDGLVNIGGVDIVLGGTTTTNQSNCEIDEASIFGRAVPAKEIRQLFIEGNNQYSEIYNWVDTRFGFAPAAPAGGQVGSIFRSPVIRAA